MQDKQRTMQMKVLARLAGLELPPERLERLAKLFDSIMNDADLLKAVDLDGIEPASIFRSKPGDA